MSSSALAAPGFITSILDREADERWIDVLGRTLALRYASPGDPAVLVALLDESKDPVELFPASGDRLLCLADPTGGPARTRSVRPAGRSVPRCPGRRASAGCAGWTTGSGSWGLVLAAITIGSAMVFLAFAGQGIDIVTAVYDVVGAFFGGVDPSIANSTGLRLFAVFLTLSGAAALALFYGVIADVVLSARISSVLGPQAADAKDHVIVVGLGTIGYRIAMLLRERGVNVVAAEKDADGRFVEAARRQRIPVVTSDGRTPQALRALRIDRARALVTVTSDDTANLTTAMHARALRPDLRIVLRLFDPDFAARLDAALGDFNSRSVSALAAPAFAAAAVGREVLATIPAGPKRVLVVARVPVSGGSRMDGATVAAAEALAASDDLGGCRTLALVVGDEVRWSRRTTISSPQARRWWWWRRVGRWRRWRWGHRRDRGRKGKRRRRPRQGRTPWRSRGVDAVATDIVAARNRPDSCAPRMTCRGTAPNLRSQAPTGPELARLVRPAHDLSRNGAQPPFAGPNRPGIGADPCAPRMTCRGTAPNLRSQAPTGPESARLVRPAHDLSRNGAQPPFAGPNRPGIGPTRAPRA